MEQRSNLIDEALESAAKAMADRVYAIEDRDGQLAALNAAVRYKTAVVRLKQAENPMDARLTRGLAARRAGGGAVTTIIREDRRL